MQSSPLMYWAYFLAASIIEDVRLMSLDKNNLTNENIVTLLRGYRISPSEPLQQQLIEIHMGLIRETITSLPISLINQKNIGECCSHESGHSVGLSHQSRYNASCVLTESYNSGIGVNGDQTSWAPIMGNSYAKNMTGWNVGPTPYDCSTAQDNISIIVSANGFGYRADDYTETLDNNTTALNTNNINVSGIITTSSDKDAFKIIIAQGSTIHLEVNPYSLGANNAGANLDVMLSLYNSSNTLIRSYDPLTTMNVIVDTTLATGTYYIVVDGTGNNNVSQYGSLGSYTITGARGVLAIHNVSLQGKNNNGKHLLNWNIIADEPIVKQELQASPNGTDFSTVMIDITGVKSFTNTPNKSGTILY